MNVIEVEQVDVKFLVVEVIFEVDLVEYFQVYILVLVGCVGVVVGIGEVFGEVCFDFKVEFFEVCSIGEFIE